MKKYSLWVKSLSFVLCIVLALCVATSGLGILLAGSFNMFGYEAYESWRYGRSENMAEQMAHLVMQDYAVKYSNSPQWLLEQTGFAFSIENGMSWFNLSEEDWYYEILDPRGKLVASTQKILDDPLVFAFGDMTSNYPVIVTPADATIPETTAAPEATEEPSVVAPTQTESVIDTTLAVTEPTIAAETYVENVYNPEEYYDVYYDPYTDENVWVQYDLLQGYQINIALAGEHSSDYMNGGLPMELLQWLFSFRAELIATAVGSFLLFVLALVFLMCVAGKSPVTGEVIPKGLNKLPLDLYLAAAVFISVFGSWVAYESLNVLFDQYVYRALIIALLCGCGLGITTIDVGFFMALAAQCKVTGGYWWRNSLCGRVLKLIWKYVRKALGYVGKGFRYLAKYIQEVIGMLPVIWEWIAVGGALGIVLLLICVGSTAHWYTVFPMFLWCLLFAAVVIYCGWCYGNIRKGIQRMNAGNLNEKIDTKWMYGSFKSIADELNKLAGVAKVAAEKQLKAERMKTELITNVSHDIKTPLTSVINYVDLLQQPHTEEEGTQYLEVLSRQSVRLKKLVEDLMDMSKASSGNMAVSIEEVDAVETVNQALGEFADKLEAARLTPVFHTPDLQLHMKADGKLTWRVLSNLLSNVVKYALPGTRVYIDLLRLDKSVVLSVKNISREELNISAEELTERFVRGDTSRNTEGSGLGLNIAQSLMQLQGGNLELTVDGDLFKVTLTFPTE